jgi:tetratricopeptide (TPR) repeat protein
MLPFYSFTAPKEVYPKGRDAALKAVELDDLLAEGHTSLGYLKTIYEKDWDGGEREFKRAIELNPGYTTARMCYFWHLIMRCRFDEAIEQISPALEADPLSLVINREVGCGYLYAGQYKRAIEAFKKTLDMDPGFSGVAYFLTRAYMRADMQEEALKTIERWNLTQLFPAYYLAGWNGIFYARLGKMKEARKAIDILLEQSEKGYVIPYQLASIYIIIGEYDEGFSWLEKAYEELDPWLCFLKADDFFDPVRSDPRYIALLKKIGLEP